ncbi:hypothetical protein BJ875DRAFT_503479 [Amylocarpus encephaloides]|uniref:DUF6594 domain-containing protein n=1 Tax=Amylocarpus encephaloides TaxID=45428 RepID=A0A9P7YMI0_9HELO|nr:hypothetical protein BJ875DRAFT_503479 [Amylocarpus encephaloides]
MPADDSEIALEPWKPNPVEGYPKLACHMGQYSENAIFRRFGSLNSQNLLYLQAEITHLERDLRDLESIDNQTQQGSDRVFASNWYWLDDSRHDESHPQLQLVLAIRAKLKEYNGFIIQQATIQQLSRPDEYDIRALQDWLDRPAMGNLAFEGADRHTWGDLKTPINPDSDLLALSSRGEVSSDPFSCWFSEKFVPWFHHIFWHRVKKPQDLETGIARYRDDAIHRFTLSITTVVASLLPVLAIIILYCVKSMSTRLGLVGLFTTIFSFSLMVFTNAKRGEIFAATST